MKTIFFVNRSWLEDAVCFVGKEMPFFERLRTRGFVTDMASGAKHK